MYYKKYLNELIDVISKISDDKSLLKEFLIDLLTEKELEDIPKRWQIVKQLAEGKAHRDISHDLGVGIATVTRGAAEFKDRKGGFYRVSELV